MNLEKNLATVESLRNLFQSLRIVLVENDSTDGTKEILTDLEARDSSAIIEMKDEGTITLPKNLSSGVNPSYSFHRVSKMARYRNRYLELIGEKIGYKNLDWVCMLDWDVEGFSQEGFFDSLNCADKWDVATANGRSKVGISKDVYYDAFAYRSLNAKGACTEKSILEGRGEIDDLLHANKLIRVESAFNALGVYRSEALINQLYRAEKNEDSRVEVWCEHVPFHRDLAMKGFDRIVINPKMLVQYNTRRSAIILSCKTAVRKLLGVICNFGIRHIKY